MASCLTGRFAPRLSLTPNSRANRSVARRNAQPWPRFCAGPRSIPRAEPGPNRTGIGKPSAEITAAADAFGRQPTAAPLLTTSPAALIKYWKTYQQRHGAADALAHRCSALDARYRLSATLCCNVTCSGQPLAYGLAG